MKLNYNKRSYIAIAFLICSIILYVYTYHEDINHLHVRIEELNRLISKMNDTANKNHIELKLLFEEAHLERIKLHTHSGTLFDKMYQLLLSS